MLETNYTKGLESLMKTSITQKNTKRYLPHELKTRIKAVEMYRNNGDVGYTCRKYHISRYSLWRWNKKYDGTKESLMDKSHKPHAAHPSAHTTEELKWIKDLIKRNPNITLNEVWYKLKRSKGYSRKPTSLYRVLVRLGFYKTEKLKDTSKYKPKKYDTPTELGVKWQVDVKYVPKECKVGLVDSDFYQYTCIDEASRQRYIYPYHEITSANSVDFVKRCIRFFGYKTKEIQTDNGQEFTFNQAKIKKIHPFTKALNELEIRHHKIRPRTPRHNGKVERSHRSDNERFYSTLKFYSFDDLKNQMQRYLRRSNDIPMAVLNYLTPKEMRKELELTL